MSGHRPVEVSLDWLPRIQAAADEVDQARQQLAAAITRRDGLIVGAADDGLAQKAIANAARMAQSRVIAILSTPQPDDEEGVQ